MADVICPSCGAVIPVPPAPPSCRTPAPKKSGLGGCGLGCLVAAVATPFIVAVVGILAAIAIPAFVNARAEAQRQVCAANLKKIDAAKMELAIARNSNPGDTLPERDVLKRVEAGGRGLSCPKGGRYAYNPVGQEPSCSVHGTMSVAVRGRAVSRPLASEGGSPADELPLER